MIARYEYFQDSAGEWRWTAYASNGEPIARSSEGYVNLSDCLHAIELMQQSGDAAVLPRAKGRRINLNGPEPLEVTLARLLMRSHS
jgi:uncharacterized protein YegP (UPF0339 family)